MARARLLIERGDTLQRTVVWDDPTGDPIDLTGAIVTCEISVAEVIYDLTEGDGLEVDDLAGEIAVTLTADETAEFAEQFGTWRLRVRSYGDIVETLAEGLVFVSF